MKHLKKFLERIIEGILTLSGTVTSITILLIILFLFTEGIGLFNSPSVEKGYALYTHSDNKVDDLNVSQIKSIFDLEITNWQEVGGENQEIYLFRFNDIFNMYTKDELAENYRSEEHTSELQSRGHLVCRLLLDKKKKKKITILP